MAEHQKLCLALMIILQVTQMLTKMGGLRALCTLCCSGYGCAVLVQANILPLTVALFSGTRPLPKLRRIQAST